MGSAFVDPWRFWKLRYPTCLPEELDWLTLPPSRYICPWCQQRRWGINLWPYVASLEVSSIALNGVLVLVFCTVIKKMGVGSDCFLTLREKGCHFQREGNAKCWSKLLLHFCLLFWETVQCMTQMNAFYCTQASPLFASHTSTHWWENTDSPNGHRTHRRNSCIRHVYTLCRRSGSSS